MAITKFRQLIKPGQNGSDVTAVKHTLLNMHIEGSGALGRTSHAGPQFVKCIKHVQRHHGIKEDGIYGKDTHKIIAPHFTDKDVELYKKARIRKPAIPAVTSLNAQKAAQFLLTEHKKGNYHTDNSGDLSDIERTAAGKPVWSPLGYWAYIDKRPLEALLWLITKQKLVIGTFAICSDHHTIDGRHGHNGGHAVDIDSINGTPIVVYSNTSRMNTLKVAKLLRSGMPAGLKPWQLICDGYGRVYNADIASQILPYRNFYTYSTLAAHRNHIHFGYWGS